MTTLTGLGAGRILPIGPDGVATGELEGHLAVHGPLDLPHRPDDRWAAAVTAELAAAGVLGRGGAGFPVERKWASLRSRARTPLLVVNAMEGEPASAKDRVLLGRAPHLVLDGAELVATVLSASKIVVCVADDQGPVASSVHAAANEREVRGLDRIPVEVCRPPGRYVSGEESALVHWLGGGDAAPVLRLDKSVPLTIGRRPVLVHNAETLAQVALVGRHGAEWFRRVGTDEAPGSTLVTISGAVSAPGVYEVALGTPLDEVVARAGLEIDLSGVLLGGYGGAWLAPSRLATPYAPGPLKEAGATLGVGIIVALPTGACGIAETARIVRHMAGESAGQCGPCVFGLAHLAGDLEALWACRADAGATDRIGARADAIDGRGACRLPDGVVRLVRSALEVFADDAAAHASGRPCTGQLAPSLLPMPRRAARWTAAGRSRR